MTVARGLKASEVFVAGGLPTITYNPRAQLGLEEQVQDYLDERYRILSVFGPTKTGKTVLVRTVLRDQAAVWVNGGTIRSTTDLWATVADHLGLNTGEEFSRQTTDQELRGMAGELQLPALGKLSKSGQESESTTVTDRFTRTRSVEIAARNALRSSLVPLIIDDFHYILPDVQAELVRSLKDLVFDGLPVIVIAVPHRAYDVVRVEKEMTGRVQQLAVGFWFNDELRGIASKGFEALNVVDEDNLVGNRLAEESFASPHLMQDFCLHTLKSSGVREYQPDAARLVEPQWRSFFEERATAASKTAFDLLARGPRQRTDRKPRELKSGMVVDIYGAVLMAIGRTGPLTSITYPTLRAAMKDIAGENAPRGQEVVRILDEMSKIAREQIAGEPVVDYDSKMMTLHISDPYFAFFLKWRAAAELDARAETIQPMFPDESERVASSYTAVEHSSPRLPPPRKQMETVRNLSRKIKNPGRRPGRRKR